MAGEKKEIFQPRYEKLFDSVRNKAGFQEQLSKLPPDSRERFEKEMAEFLKQLTKSIPNL